MKTTEKHYVTFISPGTLFAETTTRPIDSWDPKTALALSEDVVERYNARPYGFYFETRLEAEPVPDGRGGTMRVEPRSLRKSACHFMGGRIETVDDVIARNDPTERILRSNMESSSPLVVVVERGYRSVLSFDEDPRREAFAPSSSSSTPVREVPIRLLEHGTPDVHCRAPERASDLRRREGRQRMKHDLWDAAKLKMKQLEAEIKASSATQREKSNMLHSHSKLCMFACDAWDQEVVRPSKRRANTNKKWS